MNSAIVKFNQKIRLYLTDDINDAYSNTVKLIMTLYPGTNDYYTVFDSFTFRLGMAMLTIPVIDEHDKIIGYRPKIKYYPNNLFNKEAGTEDLIDSISPVSFDNAYACLAKESLYRITSIKGLAEIIADFQTAVPK